MSASVTSTTIFQLLWELPNIFETDIARVPAPPSAKFYLIEDGNETEMVAFRCLGSGGAKRALSLRDGRVLLIPTSTEISLTMWNRMVHEEVEWSCHVRAQGILAIDSKKIGIRAKKNEPHVFAYVCSSFASLAIRHIYIRDENNPAGSTWNPDNFESLSYDEQSRHGGHRPIFTKREDLLNPEKWFPLFSDLIDDVSKMEETSFYPAGESLNFAVITDDHKVPRSIRPFFFDFSSKFGENPLKVRVAKPLGKSPLMERIGRVLDLFLFSLHKHHVEISIAEQQIMIAKLTDLCWVEYRRRHIL